MIAILCLPQHIEINYRTEQEILAKLISLHIIVIKKVDAQQDELMTARTKSRLFWKYSSWIP